MSSYCMAHFVVQREVAIPGTIQTVYETFRDTNGVQQTVPVQRPMTQWVAHVTHCTRPEHDDNTPHFDGLQYDPTWTKPVVPRFGKVAEADAWLDRARR